MNIDVLYDWLLELKRDAEQLLLKIEWAEDSYEDMETRKKCLKESLQLDGLLYDIEQVKENMK